MAWPVDIPIALDAPPRLRLAGAARHGRQPVERYRLKHAWCLHLYGYHAHLEVPGRTLELEPGCLTVLPPDTPLVYRYTGPSEHLFAHFAWDADASGRGVTRPIAVFHQSGTVLPEQQHRFDQVAQTWATTPRRAEALLWTLLWDLATATRARQSDTETSPVVARAKAVIETKLHRPLRVAALAHELGVSHNHLTRLFRQHTGGTVVGYLQSRRVHRARWLLTDTTLPVASVAAEVGVADLQQFNKMMRRHTGRSPRALRGIKQGA